MGVFDFVRKGYEYIIGKKETPDYGSVNKSTSPTTSQDIVNAGKQSADRARTDLNTTIQKGGGNVGGVVDANKNLAGGITITITQPSKSSGSRTSNSNVTQDPGSISRAPDSNTIQKPYDVRDDMTVPEKLSSVGNQYTSGDLYVKAGQQATGTGDYQYPSPFGALGTLFSPLNVFGSTMTKGDIMSKDIYSSGSGIYNPGTGKYEPWAIERGGMTGYDRANMELYLNPDLRKDLSSPDAISKDVASDVINDLKPKYEGARDSAFQFYQGEIDAGRMTVSQATFAQSQVMQALNREFDIEAQSSFSTRIKSPEVQARFEKYQAFKSKIADLNSPAYTPPSKVFETGAIIGGTFLTGGAGQVFNAMVLVEGASLSYQGISEKSIGKVAFGSVLFAGGAYSTFKSVAKEITLARIEEVTQQTPRVLGGTRTKLSEGLFLDEYKFIQKTPEAQALTTETIYSRQMGQRSFAVIGDSRTIAKANDFWTDKTVYVGGEQRIIGVGTGVTDQDLSMSIGYIEGYQKYSWYGFINKGMLEGEMNVFPNKLKPSTAFVSGVSRKVDNVIVSLSGNTKEAEIFVPYEGQKVTFTRFGTFESPILGEPILVNTGFDLETLGFLKYRDFSQPLESQRYTFYVGKSKGTKPMEQLFNVQDQGLAGASRALGTSPRISPSFSSTESFGGGTIVKPKTSQRTRSEPGFKGPQTPTVQLTEQFTMQQNDLPTFPPIVIETPFIGSRTKGTPKFNTPSMEALGQFQDTPQIQTPFKGLSQLNGFYPGSPQIRFNYDIPFRGLGAGFPILPDFDAGFPTSGEPGSRGQRFRYTPDFPSIIFDIKGTAPKGGTGNPFISRPVTRGFSFFESLHISGFKMKSLF